MVRIRLSRLLGEKRLTQKDLAKRTGIRAATVNEYYHELNIRINLEHISKICEALNCNVSDLLEYVPDGVPSEEDKQQGYALSGK